MSAPNRLGTPIKQGQPSSAPAAPTGPPPPPPVIPTSWLAPHEQRWFFVSIVGLIEAIKVWDVLAPYFILHPEPTWSSALRVRGVWTASGWTLFELSVFAAVALLRIPMLSPSRQQLVWLSFGLIGWNVACWFVAEPGSFFQSIHLVGPTALGAEWYWNWWYAFRRWREPSHIAGVHKIRLLPYSTATFNPLSLTYCIPPDAPQPLFIPIVFNNSVPDEIAYSVRSLETGLESVHSVYAGSLKKGRHAKPQSLLTEGDDDEDIDADTPDPLSAIVLRSGNMDVAKLPSVKPADSLTLAPQKLSSSESVLFLSIDKPSVVKLKSAVDSGKNGFHITPHREAVIIECPTGGHFVDDKEGQLVKRPSKPQPAELRCQGGEEVVKFQARGVGPLRATWKKSGAKADSGVIEGIEDLTYKDRVSRTYTVPLRVSHDQPGVHKVALTGVSDSMHNTYVPSGHSTERTFNVIPRPVAQFGSSSPRELLVGKSISLPISLDGLSSEVTELVYSFTPVEGEAWNKTLKVTRRSESITAAEPGVYSLVELNGPCGGTIMEPSSCVVQLVPPPTLDMDVRTLHECARDVGATVSFEFNGLPPFNVEYTEQRNKQRPITRSARFNGHAGEIVLTPEHEGEYTYTFVSLGDAKYSQVKLDQPPVKQTVHPLASAELLGTKKRKLYACSGNEVEVEFETKGADPLSLSYHVYHNGHASNHTWRGPPGRQSMRVQVPAELADDRGGSGKFSITLLSVEDGNGCARKLNAPTVDVEVDRKRPTLRFAQSQKVTVVEGETVKAPLRLTGTGPWEVTYSIDGKKTHVTMRDPNNALMFDKKGVYKLEQVKDAHCPGLVLAESSYEIEYKPRPSVRLGTSASAGRAITSGKTELCEGEEQQVALTFSGQPPFELVYRHTTDGKTSRNVLKSAQETGVLHLAIEAGSHRYDLTELKDANYAKHPVSLTLEHQVNSRPHITFAKGNTKPVCLDKPLAGDAKIRLSGKAPFEIGLSVRRPGSSRLQHFEITSATHEWSLDLPYEAKDVGRHEVAITSFKDSSHCEWDRREGDVMSTTVEVVESARIVPVNSVKDLCVGDTLDFLLQGKAPWTVEFEWLGKTHKSSSSASSFSRYAERPGVFSVKSVSLKDNQCKREINGMDRTVHPLPSAMIEEGAINLREGDNPALFSVSFTGTAPFSFTYTRSEKVGSKRKVVETQTITDIWEDSYNIESSLPGDYVVTSVSDKYCRYPPLAQTRES